jgi:hypothetical protein
MCRKNVRLLPSAKAPSLDKRSRLSPATRVPQWSTETTGLVERIMSRTMATHLMWHKAAVRSPLTALTLETALTGGA